MRSRLADGEDIHAVAGIHRGSGKGAFELAEELLRPELEDQILAIRFQAQVRELDLLRGTPLRSNFPFLLAPFSPTGYAQAPTMVERPVNLLQPPGVRAVAAS